MVVFWPYTSASSHFTPLVRPGFFLPRALTLYMSMKATVSTHCPSGN